MTANDSAGTLGIERSSLFEVATVISGQQAVLQRSGLKSCVLRWFDDSKVMEGIAVAVKGVRTGEAMRLDGEALQEAEQEGAGGLRNVQEEN